MRLRALSALLATALVAGSALVAAPAQAAREPRPLVTGWFGYWASNEDLDRMIRESEGVVGEVNVFWWSFQGRSNPLCTYDVYRGSCSSTGSTPWTNDRLDEIRRKLQGAGIRVQGSITDVYSGTAGQLSGYLEDPADRQAYADKIAKWADNAGLDGVDLDWENFAFNDGRASWGETEDRWVDTVRRLGAALHARGLTLSATVPGGVPPFNSDGSPNPGTGYWVYAWDRIIDDIDRLIIMTYDYSWSTPGPIGPNDWAREVARSAVAQVGKGNSEKVWVGSPQYGRSWPLSDGSGWITHPRCPDNWKATETPVRQVFSPAAAWAAAEQANVKPEWHSDSGEWSFSYYSPVAGKVGKKARSCGVKRELWFGDTRSALARAKIVPDQRIGGIAVWEFGDVDADFYRELADYGRSLSQVSTKVQVSAPGKVVYGEKAKIKVSATSSKGPAAEERATLYWKPLSRGKEREIDTITLDDKGEGVFTVTGERSGEWWVSVEGSFARARGESKPVKTMVGFAVEAEASTENPLAGDVVTLTAKVAPALPGAKVQVQRQTKDGWVTLKTVDVPKNGVATADVRPTLAGDVSYRMLVPRLGHYALGKSGVITLEVSRASGAVRTLGW